ncbi:MAG: diacylglycerol kinase family protein [Clostridia bacterium]|nr:diacylglycerol kinase family protein [Clostridia bacterium]
MANYRILYNSLSGNGTGKEQAEALKGKLDGSLEFTDITGIADYRSFFEELPAGTIPVLCGGDGTLNRFVNDCEAAGAVIPDCILYYAGGTGNDFLRDIGTVPGSDPVPVAKYIKDLPVADIEGKKYRFFNGVGFGIDGYCCEEGDRQRSIPGKKINYTSIAIGGLLGKYRPRDVRVTVDGVEHFFRKAWLAPVMKGRFYGGGMMAAPDQDRLDPDGLLTAMIFHGSGKLRTLMIFPGIFKGEHVKHTKNISVLKGRDITVEYFEPTPLQVDGETVSGVKVCRCTAAKKD